VITAQGLTRSFRTRSGPVAAVNGIDLQVEPGCVVAFLGPNGAGKTTTVRMLATLLTPTGGQATVGGYDVVRERDRVRRIIGYVGQASSVADHRVEDELVTQARLQGMSRAAGRVRAAGMIERFELGAVRARTLTKLSGGQRRRFDLALGLINEPRVLFLDEPSVGLDPQSRANLWEHLRTLRATEGTTVFLTTHNLDEADLLSDRIIVIDGGRVIASDTAEALKSQVGGDVVTLETDQLSATATVLAGVVPGCDLDTAPGVVRFRIAQAQRRLPELLRALDQAGIELASVSVKRPTLDDVLLRLTGRSLREDTLPAAATEPSRPEPSDPSTAAPAQPEPAEVNS
jgi:ABC-2 type transport system ATP-binding protein